MLFNFFNTDLKGQEADLKHTYQPFYKNVDSLKHELSKATSPRDRIRLNTEISYHYWWNEKYTKGIPFAKNGVEIGKKNNLEKESVYSYQVLSSLYSYLNELDSFLVYNQKLIHQAQIHKNVGALIEGLNERGVYFTLTQRKDSALVYYNRVYHLSDSLDNKLFIASVSSSIGNLFKSIQMNERARSYYYKALNSNGLSEYQYSRFFIYRSLAELQMEEGKKDSLDYFIEKCKEISENLNYQNIRFSLDLLLFSKAFKEDDHDLMQLCLVSMKNNTDFTQYTFEEMDFFICKAKYLMKNEKYHAANDILLKLVQNPKFKRKFGFQRTLELISKCYHETKDFELSNSYLNRYHKIMDSLNEPIQKFQILALETEYDLRSKESKLALLQLQQEKKNRTLALQRFQLFLIGLVSVFFLIISIILYFNNRAKKHLSQKLTKEVESQTAELAHTNSRLTKKIDELTAFSHITSHDLKQPLRNISSFSELLQLKLNNKIDDKSNEYLNFIHSSTHQMEKLLNSLEYYNSLDSVQLMSNALSLNNLNQIINEAQGLISEQYLTENSTVLHTGTDVMIQTAPALLVIVLKNLIENGLKYNHSKQKIVEVNYSSSSTKHYILVKDNGIGIDSKFHQSVFKMFERLHTSAEYSGSGLGLSICKKLISGLNGNLELKSTLASGSIFSIILPRT